MSWFVHHPLWTLLAGLLGALFGAPLLWGCLGALAYYLFVETKGAIEDWAKWRVGKVLASRPRGPWRDYRKHERGFWVGFMWDHLGDIAGPLAVVLLVWLGEVA